MTNADRIALYLILAIAAHLAGLTIAQWTATVTALMYTAGCCVEAAHYWRDYRDRRDRQSETRATIDDIRESLKTYRRDRP